MPSRLTVVLVSLLVATPAVMFWLWLVILPATVTKTCSATRWNDPGGYAVECYRSSLNNIPLTFPTYVRYLLLDFNNITSLEKDIFIRRGLTELEKFRAGVCGIRTIEVGAFNGLTKLTYLSMPGNEISEILPGTFEKMGSLEVLDLTSNRIEQLQVGVFSGLNNLKYIGLRGNKLQYLHSDTFIGLPNLKKLDLDYNRGLQVPTDRHFISSHSLSHLYISHCNVSSVSRKTFANVTALEQLDLSDNNLRTVNINILKALPKLSAMYLYGNPLQCYCQLQKVWRWCQDHNIETAYRETAPKCRTPSKVRGKWWGVLEKSQCLQSKISYYEDYKNTSYSYTPAEETDVDLFVNRLEFLKRLQVPVYTVPFILGTTGNVILLIIITCNRDMRTVPNMYILNLAISDLIYLTLHFAEACADKIPNKRTYEDLMWQYDDFTCRFFPFCRRLSVGLSAYSVAVLSIQRYRVTVNPLHVRVSSQPTWRATVATICGVWFVAVLFALPSPLSGHLCDECWLYGCEIYHQRVALFELLVSCVLPLCVIAFSYIMTARHLLKSARPISEDTQRPQLNTRTNTAKIVLGLTVVFLISYVPYHAYWTYYTFGIVSYFGDNYYSNKRYILEYTRYVSTCFLLINPCLNPVALFCTGLAFRRQFKRCLTCCCKPNPTVTDTELTRTN